MKPMEFDFTLQEGIINIFNLNGYLLVMGYVFIWLNVKRKNMCLIGNKKNYL